MQHPVAVVGGMATGGARSNCVLASMGGHLNFHPTHGWASTLAALCEDPLGPNHHPDDDDDERSDRSSATLAVRVELWPPHTAPEEWARVHLGHQQSVHLVHRCPPTADDEVDDESGIERGREVDRAQKEEDEDMDDDGDVPGGAHASVRTRSGTHSDDSLNAPATSVDCVCTGPSATWSAAEPTREKLIVSAAAKPGPTASSLVTSMPITPPVLAVRLAACAVAVDPFRGTVLLTRRPHGMRTFPRAWVTPGGSVDHDDASVASAALRELKEETGLDGTNPHLLCMWESAYPPSADEWRAARAAGRRCAHHIIVFYVVHTSSTTALTLQPEECDAACWVPVADFAARATPTSTMAASPPSANAAATPSAAYEMAAGCANAGSMVDAELIHGGVYPSAAGQGVGRGHLFAISQLAATPTAWTAQL